MVYSWGVLHHTRRHVGGLLDNDPLPVTPNAKLFVAIYTTPAARVHAGRINESTPNCLRVENAVRADGDGT